MLGFDALSKRSRVARRLVLNAAAKINLALEVLGKRDDGYHEVATVMQAVDLSDRLGIQDAEGLELRVSAPDLPSDGRNLVVRAAHALREATAVSRGARITLDKRIPVAAGLGGGTAGPPTAPRGGPVQRARACRGDGVQAGGADGSRAPGGGRAGRSDVGQRAHRVRRRALVRPRAADPGARRPGLLGVLGGARDSRPGDSDDPGPLRRRERWGVAKWQGAGLWIPYSEVRILPPQPHLERGTDGLRTEALDGEREPAAGRGDPAGPARAAGGRGGDALLGRRGVPADQRKRPRRGRGRDPADVPAGERHAHGAAHHDRRAEARLRAPNHGGPSPPPPPPARPAGPAAGAHLAAARSPPARNGPRRPRAPARSPPRAGPGALPR